MLQNAVDIDFYGRSYNLEFLNEFSEGQPEWEFKNRPLDTDDLKLLGNIPIIAFFDYAAAFPSVAHAWLFAVLAALGVPTGLLNAISVLYRGNRGFCNLFTDRPLRRGNRGPPGPV